MRRSSLTFIVFLLASFMPARATVFATVHGVVHDQQHRPIVGAEVKLQAADSAFALRASTDSHGEFEIPQVPIGVYQLGVSAPGFATFSQSITIASGTNPVLHIPFSLETASQTVFVNGSADSDASTDSVTPTTLITRAEH